MKERGTLKHAECCGICVILWAWKKKKPNDIVYHIPFWYHQIFKILWLNLGSEGPPRCAGRSPENLHQSPPSGAPCRLHMHAIATVKFYLLACRPGHEVDACGRVVLSWVELWALGDKPEQSKASKSPSSLCQSMPTAVDALKGFFPGVPETTLQDALQQVNGNLDNAASLLLERAAMPVRWSSKPSVKVLATLSQTYCLNKQQSKRNLARARPCRLSSAYMLHIKPSFLLLSTRIAWDRTEAVLVIQWYGQILQIHAISADKLWVYQRRYQANAPAKCTYFVPQSPGASRLQSRVGRPQQRKGSGWHSLSAEKQQKCRSNSPVARYVNEHGKEAAPSLEESFPELHVSPQTMQQSQARCLAVLCIFVVLSGIAKREEWMAISKYEGYSRHPWVIGIVCRLLQTIDVCTKIPEAW